MRMLKGMATLLAATMLAACGGGGGNAGTSGFGGGGGTDTGSTVSTVEVIASSTDVGSGDVVGVTVSAIVKGPGNVSLSGSTVVFSTDTGTLGSVSAVTDSAGVATAKFSAGSDKTNRTARISATAGGVTGTIDVNIVGTALAFSGTTTLTLGSEATLTVKATDSGGNAIPNLAVAVSSSLGNGLSSATVTTDGQGSASVTYAATSAGSDTVAFTGAGATVSTTLTISGEDFKFISPIAGTQVPVGTSQVLTVQYLKNGIAQSGVTVNFASTAGQLSVASVVTNASGQASVSISSASAAAATVQATFTQGGTTASATLPIQFVATTPATLVLQVSPSAIGPNVAGSTTQQAQVQARVVDSNGNPVANQTVNFSRDLDPSGGNLSQPSDVTDLNGLATVQYISGPQSTGSNGVQLRGTVSGTLIAGTATLTVNQAALFIALGTGNVITNLDTQTYKKDWVVYVTDSDGIAVSGVTLTIRVLPTRYRKGSLFFDGDSWVYGFVSPMCASEDVNQNGVLDLSPDEDFNGNGKLEPGNVISVTPGNVTTDINGRATISLIYAESYVPWVEVKLSATATVAGTESKNESVFIVDGLASDFTSENVAPAGQTSPFGTAVDCSLPS